MKKILLITLLFNIKQIIAQVCFSSETNFAAGTNSEKIIKGDFNSDGLIDLATCNPGSNDVSIFLGIGNGSFSSSTSFTVGNFPADITTNDFNGDGKLDIATANYSSNNVSILLGNGTGSFSLTSTINFVFGYTPFVIISNDFNGDGNTDLVVSAYNQDSVSIMLGTGTGSFGAIKSFDSNPGLATDIISMDFNKDGNLDLALANGVADKVSMLLGTGTGSFVPAVSFTVTVGSGPNSLTSADFNGDSKLDLALVNSTSNDVSVLMGIGNGSFGLPVNFVVGTQPYSISTIDFNLDGKIDLVSNNHNSNFVSVLLGTGGGSFAPALSYTTSTDLSDVVSGDFNGDGKPDLAMANNVANNIGVLLNCSSTPTCIASVSDSIFQDVQPLTWNILPQYSPQVNNAKWYWGDGTYSNGLYPSHTYTAAGWYSICVTVYTSCGDSASTCRNDSIFRYANNSSSMIQVNVISSITTGTENMENTKNETILYPNPSNGKFIIEATHAVNQSIQIFDLNGKLVLTQHNDGKANIDASNLSEGIYNLIIKNNASIIHKKIIIVK